MAGVRGRELTMHLCNAGKLTRGTGMRRDSGASSKHCARSGTDNGTMRAGVR